MTPAEFKTLYPKFAAESDARLQAFIDLSVLELDETRWGDLYSRGLGLLTAHSLTTDSQDAATATSAVADLTTQKKVGDVSVSRSEAMLQAQASDPLLRTAYGQEFKRLRRMVGMGAWAV